MADTTKPFKLDDAKGRGIRPSGIGRAPDGRFVRENAVPENPIEKEQTSSSKPSEWAPGIGKNSAELQGQKNPYPETEKPKSPMRVK